MAVPDQESLNDEAITILTGTISPERLGTYLAAAGHDPKRALRLYLWNAQIGEAFHVPIQAVEVGLRNRINTALIAAFGPDWWNEQAYLALIDSERAGDIDQVLRRMRNRGLPKVTGQVVAGLSFGFWVGMLQGAYNPPIWSGLLRPTFPHLPADRSRRSLEKTAREVAYVRNRIWHHEPIFKRDLSRDHSNVMTILGWICPTKAGWVVPHCRVPELLRMKP